MTTLKIDELMLECKRQGIKITQKDLAEAAGIGQTAIHKIIRGDTQAPKPQILVAIADHFTEALARKITVDDLIVRSETHGTEDDSLPRVVETSRSPFGATDWMQVNEGGPVTDGHFISVPILGNIPHGDLDQVVPEDMLGYEHVYKRDIGRGRFFLRARGDAMAPLILDGDLLLIEPGPQWKHKTIVAIYMDRHVTCKQLYLHDNTSALVSANPNYAPIIVTEDMVIIGRVIKIERNLVEDWQP